MLATKIFKNQGFILTTISANSKIDFVFALMKCNYVAFREQNKRMYLVGERWVRVGEVG